MITIDELKTNGFTRKRLFDILVGLKFGLEGYPHVFELMLCERTKRLYSRWKHQSLIHHELKREFSKNFFHENPFINMMREGNWDSCDGGTFIQEPLIYDRPR